MSPTKMKPPPTVSSQLGRSLWQRVNGFFSFYYKVLTVFVPFLIRHRPSLKQELVTRLIDAVPPTASVGVAGYCYGAATMWIALKFKHERVSACFVAHPSFSTAEDVMSAPTKLSVAFPEVDWVMGKNQVRPEPVALLSKSPTERRCCLADERSRCRTQKARRL